MLVNSILLTSDWCSVENIHLSTYSERPIKAASLRQGTQRIDVPLSDFGRGFVAPIGDKSYPDDTLIAIEYADQAMPPDN